MKYSIDQLRQVKGIGKKTIQRIIEQFDKSEYVSEYDSSIHINPNSLIHGDMLVEMNGVPDKSIDMILTDLPYGTTQNTWDSVIDLDKVWKQYNRVIKDNGAIVLFAQTPFDKMLGASNIQNLRYEWVWQKNKATGHLNAKRMPLKEHENILVFYKNLPTYKPQGLIEKKIPTINRGDRGLKEQGAGGTNYGLSNKDAIQTHENYPRSVLNFPVVMRPSHPTEKPVKLLEYLINTYTEPADIVLDSTMGTGSTGVAAKSTGRRFIGIELDKKYFGISTKRIEDAK